MSVDVGKATGYLDLDISGFLKGLKTAQEEANNKTESMSQQLSKGFQGIGSTLSSVGSTLTKSVTTPVIGVGAAIIKTSSDFESAMSKVQSISGASGDDFARLNEKAREMGASTKFSASEAAEAFQYMAMAGWDVENMMGGISGVMNLAAASGEDLASVSDIVTDAMTAFGLSADGTSMVLKDGLMTQVDNTTRFVDALAAASNSSNTNVAMLGESFKYVAPVAGALGYSVEDTAIALGLMANQGIKASQSGTALRTMLTNMANPTETMSDAMDTLGVSLERSDGSMKPLIEVLGDLRNGFGGGNMDAAEFANTMSELQNSFDEGKISEDEYSAAVEEASVAMYGAEGAMKAQIAAQLAGKTGMAGLLAIVNTSEEDFNKLSESIYNASGTSQEMADIMNDTLSGQLTIAGSAVQELALQFGEIMLPTLRDVVQWLQDLIAKLQGLSPEQKETIARFALLAATIGPVLLVLGGITGAIGNMITMFGAVKQSITALSSGFGMLKSAATNVSEGFKLAKAGFPALGAEASKLGALLGGVTAPMLAIVAVIAVVVAAIVTLWNTNEDFRNKVIAIWEGIKESFAEFGQGIVDRISELGVEFSSIVGVIKAVWQGFCDLLAPIFVLAFEIIGTTLDTVLGIILGLLDVFIGVFTGNWSQVWTGVKEIFTTNWEGLAELFTSVTNTILEVANTVLGWFGTDWNTVWSNISTFFSTTWEGIKKFFNDTVTSIKEFASTTWESISTTITTVFTSVSNFFHTVWTAIKTTITTAVNSIKSTLNTVWNAIRTIIETVLNNISTVITNVWNSIKITITTVINAIKSTLETVWNAIRTTITNIVNGIKQTVTNVFESIKTTLTNTVNNIKTNIVNAFNNIKSSVTNTVNSLKETISSVFERIKSAMSDSINAAKESVVSTMQSAKDLVVGVWDGITDTFADIGKNIIQGIINGIGSMLGNLYEAIRDGLSGLVDKAKDELGIESPSKVLRDQIGKWMPPGIAVGFVSAMGKATKTMQTSLSKGVNSLHADDVSIGIKDNMIGVMSHIAEYFEAVETRLANAVSNMRDYLEYLINAGSAALNGVTLGYIGYNGIQSGSGNKDGGNGAEGVTNGNSGNTYVFYSTKAIDEIEAARQMRITERDMAEGFI